MIIHGWTIHGPTLVSLPVQGWVVLLVPQQRSDHEANSLDPTTVKWSSVRADGEDKWLKKAGEAASAAGGRKPMVYPVLSGRDRRARGRSSRELTYKEALEYAAGATTGGIE